MQRLLIGSALFRVGSGATHGVAGIAAILALCGAWCVIVHAQEPAVPEPLDAIEIIAVQTTRFFPNIETAQLFDSGEGKPDFERTTTVRVLAAGLRAGAANAKVRADFLAERRMTVEELALGVTPSGSVLVLDEPVMYSLVMNATGGIESINVESLWCATPGLLCLAELMRPSHIVMLAVSPLAFHPLGLERFVRQDGIPVAPCSADPPAGWRRFEVDTSTISGADIADFDDYTRRRQRLMEEKYLIYRHDRWSDETKLYVTVDEETMTVRRFDRGCGDPVLDRKHPMHNEVITVTQLSERPLADGNYWPVRAVIHQYNSINNRAGIIDYEVLSLKLNEEVDLSLLRLPEIPKGTRVKDEITHEVYYAE